MSASGKVVVITGGGRGIGAAITRAFHDAGARVAIASRRDSGLARELGERACFVACDVTARRSVREAIESVVGWGGRLDVLVNNAGRSEWRPLEDIDETFWSEMLAVNLHGVLWASQAAVPHLARGGCIVNVSSLAGKRGSANNSAYCAAKFAVNGVTQALAKELGPRGIRVNAVCPVYVETDGLADALVGRGAPAHGQDVGTFLRDFARIQAALGRLPTAEEVAAACVMLASGKMSAITGQCINVDCGVLPQ